MNIAISVWGQRISPVLEASQALLIVEIERGAIVSRITVSITGGSYSRLNDLLREYRVELLICGAICELGIEHIESEGVEVIPFLTGKIDILLKQFLSGEEWTQFAMPGCRIGGCCRGYGKSRSGRGH